MKQSAVRLKRHAVETARWRGHSMGKYRLVENTPTRSVYCAVCSECCMAVFVDSNPPPNGIDIAGEAIALNCKHPKTEDTND